MKHSRRSFLIGSLGLTFGSYASAANGGGQVPRGPRKPPKSQLGYRLSSPMGDLQDHYDAVIVGSGYGASVMAARLKSKYPTMCILERGKEWHPGEFPELPTETRDTLKTPVNPLGLIDVEAGQDIDIVCGNGLGGTSLINAAISIRPEMNLFELPVWPEEIRKEAKSGQLEEYYKRAESVLQPQQTNAIRFGKTQLHKKDTDEMGRPFGELKLNIRPDSYGEAQKNAFGYPQSGCTHCGNCCSGCNYGAKNTLVTNYLYIAHQRGVKIFTQTEVETIEKKNGVYHLHVKFVSGFNGERVQSFRRKVVTAGTVFLGAGSKGSTQILMRSESADLRFSKALGTKLSANGDVMGLSYNGRSKTNSRALPPEVLKETPMGERPGEIIASYANYRSPSLENDVTSQFLLLDGVIPSALAPTVEKLFAIAGLSNRKKFIDAFPEEERSERANRMWRDFFGINSKGDGALNHSRLYFACGHDSSGGRFVYNKQSDRFDYIWKDVLKEPTFLRIQSVMRKFAEKNGGTFIENPRSSGLVGEKIQATHPLGGCPMGSNVESAVVNHCGQVFNPQGGLHENLYVVDAATLPHSLSATPLLTITAFAERIAERILKGS